MEITALFCSLSWRRVTEFALEEMASTAGSDKISSAVSALYRTKMALCIAVGSVVLAARGSQKRCRSTGHLPCTRVPRKRSLEARRKMGEKKKVFSHCQASRGENAQHGEREGEDTWIVEKAHTGLPGGDGHSTHDGGDCPSSASRLTTSKSAMSATGSRMR